MGGLKWTEGIKYNPGDIVKFKGREYKILQGHTSQGDWTPDLVPALWQAIGGGKQGSEDEGKDYKKKKSDRRSDNEDSEGERKSKDKKKDKKGGKYSEEESGGEGKKDKKKSKSKNKDEVSEEEGEKSKKKKDKDKDSKHKESKSKDEGDYKKDKKDKKDKKSKGESEEEAGGDDEHKKKDKEKSKDKDKEKKGDKEEKKDKEKKSKYHDSEEGHEHKSVAGSSGHVDVGKVPGVGQAAVKVAGAFTSSQAWIEAARKVTAEFKQSGPKGATTWVLVEDSKISPDAIRAGEDKNGIPFYVARAYYEGGLQIGRASSNGAFIGFNGREIPLTQYEVLLGDTRAIKWVASSAGAAGIRAVEGGIDNNGKQLLIAQTRYGGEVIPGKATDWINGALIALGGQEINVKDYNILAYV